MDDVAQWLAPWFPLPGVLGSNPIGDKNFWGFRYKINQHLEGFLRVLHYSLLSPCKNGIGRSPQKYKNQKTYLEFPFLIAV